MTPTRHTVATVVGGLAVLLAVGGWLVVEANTGPFEHDLGAAEHATQLEGAYIVRNGSASSPLCASPGTEQACDPETELDVAVTGLPALGEEAAYAAFLEGARIEPLGPLTASEGVHRLSFSGEIDADAYGTLLLALVEPGDRATPAFELASWSLPTSGGETVRLDERSSIQLAAVEGQVRLAQIGAVEIAVTADARIEGLPDPGPWRYEAWLVDEDVDGWTPLGTLAAGDGDHRLDARMERVRLVDQESFLVTLEPPGPVEGEPAGFPAASAAVEASTLLR